MANKNLMDKEICMSTSDEILKALHFEQYRWERPEEQEIKRLKYELENAKKTADLPERYIINENATILFWKDGEKTVVKRAEDDEFNPRLAFLTAFFQHYCGMSKNKANKYLAGLKVEEPKVKEVKVEEPKKKRGRPRKDSYKFQVGDKVIGNKLANERYNITKKGWIGTVTRIEKDYFVATGELFKEGVGLEYECFDKYKEDK